MPVAFRFDVRSSDFSRFSAKIKDLCLIENSSYLSYNDNYSCSFLQVNSPFYVKLYREHECGENLFCCLGSLKAISKSLLQRDIINVNKRASEITVLKLKILIK